MFAFDFSGWDSERQWQGKAGESYPSLQTQKLGHPGGTEHSKEVLFIFFLFVYWEMRIIDFAFEM